MAKQDASAVHSIAPAERSRKVMVVNSGKGGTGKTTVALALVDHLRRMGCEVIVVEMDTSNADVGKCYHVDNMPTGVKPPRVVPIDFERPEAWMDFVDLCLDNPAAFVVVNMKGGNVKEVAAHGKKLNDALKEARQDVVCIWVLNLYRDSVLAMRAFYKVMPIAKMYGFLNGVWGDREEFDVYHRDAIKSAIEDGSLLPEEPAKPSSPVPVEDAEDGYEDEFEDGEKFKHTLTFPKVANRILKQFFNKRRSLEAQLVSKRIRLSERIEIESWRKATGKVFDKVLA